MTFPEQVRYVREKMILSQQMLVRELGVAYATVNRGEMGQRAQKYQRKFMYCELKKISFEEKE